MGVSAGLQTLVSEIEHTMILMGAARIDELGPDRVVRGGAAWPVVPTAAAGKRDPVKLASGV